MRNAFIDELFCAAKKNSNVILLTGDLGYGCLDKFIQDLPEQYINCGISEQNMLSVAAGLAISGKKVFVYSIGNFPTMRCLEQIRNDCAYHNANVNIICVGAGFSYGSLGMSHHATEDIAIMNSLPDVKIFSPSDAAQARYVFQQMMDSNGVNYVRLGKGKEKPLQHRIIEDIECICDGNQGVLLTTGAICEECINANEQYFEETNNKFAIYTVIKLKQIDEKKIVDLLEKYTKIITVEEHSIIGGLNSIVAQILAKYGLNKKIVAVGLNDTYSSVVGDQKYLRKVYNMDSGYILSKMKNY